LPANNSGLKSAAIQAAMIAAIVSVITTGFSLWNQSQMRQDSFRIAAAELWLSAAQGYYEIISQWEQ
jgi:hypothetical protein